mmetsp:Transcript_36062/g.80260  ORF Transcript_36062/g.80260 Transcript_36062/m.80260 type:complete len:213 (-) Transcript_36062:620-1258(-)|eukprot:CAMPEP_0202889646 /NCGR_PEP_ID=MMETSP1392-20130828/243_1 /ASSEMBLY_ACC=CAM_ASM_000868 /TAXON_ID=225041 /ORGANISM="Chlamydomonas chlamydogama, Strain SAG 11-48b" /LENGTH=212 /DNA_ID=CAMNT_0049573025 /DNA_START=108 /DNA_END=746 /DNA_ORIENTATION=+
MADDKNNDEAGPREEGEVTADAPDFSKKHMLENRWTLWFDNPQTKQTLNKYGQTLRSVYTFDSVEDFWCLYNNIRTPGQLQPSATFYLFKEHIEPKWEDPKNTNGGCWTASVNRGGPNSKAQLDAWWLNGVLGCIGEQFTEGDEICGIAVNIRPKGDRIELWTKTASNEAVQTIIGRQLKQFLDIPDNMKLGYSVFSEKLSAGNKAKDRYSV